MDVIEPKLVKREIVHPKYRTSRTAIVRRSSPRRRAG